MNIVRSFVTDSHASDIKFITTEQRYFNVCKYGLCYETALFKPDLSTSQLSDFEEFVLQLFPQ